jgi:hypothetical protein
MLWQSFGAQALHTMAGPLEHWSEELFAVEVSEQRGPVNQVKPQLGTQCNYHLKHHTTQ